MPIKKTKVVTNPYTKEVVYPTKKIVNDYNKKTTTLKFSRKRK